MGLIQTVYVCTYLRPNFKEMHLYLICFLKTTTLHTLMIEDFSENSKRCNICQTLIVSVNSTKRDVQIDIANMYAYDNWLYPFTSY